MTTESTNSTDATRHDASDRSEARAPAMPKDHEIAQMVNALRDVAVQYHGQQQLRERIASIVVPALNKLRELERENNALRADAARLDWLADRDNDIGNVQLPSHCVTANLGSLRDAIDMAMHEQEHGRRRRPMPNA